MNNKVLDEFFDLSKIKEVKKVEVKKGDILVFETDSILNEKTLEALNNEFAELFPGIKCIVLDAMKLKGVLKLLAEPTEKSLEALKELGIKKIA